MTHAPATNPPIHPGEILFEAFLEPMRVTQYRLAKDRLGDRVDREVTAAAI
jgi:plasmid maintenance system antidote protein VapI